MTFENELRQNIRDLYEELGREEFVEEYNRLFGTDLTIDDVIWAGD